MTTRECVVARIRELCRQKGITPNGLAHISGLSPSTMKGIMNGASKNTGIVTIKILCDGLDITLAEFFNTDEFRSLEQEIY